MGMRAGIQGLCVGEAETGVERRAILDFLLSYFGVELGICPRTEGQIAESL